MEQPDPRPSLRSGPLGKPYLHVPEQNTCEEALRGTMRAKNGVRVSTHDTKGLVPNGLSSPYPTRLGIASLLGL